MCVNYEKAVEESRCMAGHVFPEKAVARCSDENTPPTTHTSDLFSKFKILKLSIVYEHQLLSSLKTETHKFYNLQLNISTYSTVITNIIGTFHNHITLGFQMLKNSLPRILNKYELTEEQLLVVTVV